MGFQMQTELGVQQLLNGKDLTGWYSYLEKLGKNTDPEGNFKIVSIVIIATCCGAMFVG